VPANPPITDLETIARLAAERFDDFQVMRYMLEANEDISDADLDALVERIAAPIDAAIDCTQCANCCRGLDVHLTPDDAGRLADAIDVPLHEIEIRYIDRVSAGMVGEWGRFREKPCPFLKGKLCSVYGHRPETCRTYPAFTPDFRWTLEDTIDGAGLCPIIYNVLAALVDEIDALYKRLYDVE
jgi:hypothetical protein